MKAMYFVVLALLIIGNAHSTETNQFDSIQSNDPVFAFIEYEHSSWILGAESPDFVLYQDGTVIFRKESNTFYTCNISTNTPLINSIHRASQSSLKEHYRTSVHTGHNTFVFFWKDNVIKVSGPIPNKVHSHPDISSKPDSSIQLTTNGIPRVIDRSYTEQKLLAEFPEELIHLMKTLSSFDTTQTTKWEPEHIEVMFKPYGSSSESPISWPSEWPDLKHEKTWKRGADAYSVYMPPEYYNDIKALLANQSNKRPLLINGKNMRAFIRIPFPQEEQWMK